MIKLYFTLKILIPIILIGLFVLFAIVSVIKYKLDSKFKQNCYKCKHYQLFDVASCGDSCRYRCKLKDRYDYHSMNDDDNFVKCKEFEQQ